jgi:hypothetical protein
MAQQPTGPGTGDNTGAGTARDQQALDVDWGPNASGWNVTIKNETNIDWTHVDQLPTDNVYYAPDSIPAQTNTDGIRGRQSIEGGPANMQVNYCDDPREGYVLVLWITSDNDGNVSTGVGPDPDGNPNPGITVFTQPAPVSNQPVVWVIQPSS